MRDRCPVAFPGGGRWLRDQYTPIEGSVVAYLDSVPIPTDQIEVDRASDLTVVNLPDSSSPASDGSRLLVVSMATPELPTAFSLLIDQG
jgi:hypothetical protein